MKTFYEVRTRNWNQNPKIAFLLNLTALLGVNCFKSDDHDNKYVLITSRPKLADFIYKVFLKLQSKSGGTTYKDVLPENCVNEISQCKWKIIY